MGIVVSAHHTQLDEKVALKFLLPSALKRPDVVSRFDREARAAVRIKSEHVAHVTDVGRLESGAPYMVMEYLEGVDLGVWLRKGGPLPVDEAAELVLQACEALAQAHGLGIVHRDLKPANLFCTGLGSGPFNEPSAPRRVVSASRAWRSVACSVCSCCRRRMRKRTTVPAPRAAATTAAGRRTTVRPSGMATPPRQ